MNTSPRFGLGDLLLFLLILLAAGAVRGWYLYSCCQQGNTEGPYQVQDDWSKERDSLVKNLKSGNFSVQAPLAAADEKTAHAGYLYPLMLASLDRAANDLGVTYQRVRWLQVGLGALAASFYFLIGRRAFHSRLVGFIAGVLAALNPYWVINTAEVNDGVVTTFLLALALLLGVRAGQLGGALTSILYGLSLAALASLRAALLPFAIIADLWLLWRSRRLPGGWMVAVLAILGFLIGIIPWVTRNHQAFHEVMPIADSAYLHLWIGNNSKATGGPESEETMRTALADRDGPKVADLEKMSQPERYRSLASQLGREIVAKPAQAIERRLRAGLAFFFGDKWLTDREYCRTGKTEGVPAWLTSWITTLLVGSLFFMLLLAALGWRWSYGWRRESMPLGLAPVWFLLPYLLSHAEAYSGPRLPLDGVLICYAALVIACIFPSEAKHLLTGEEAYPK
jgi:4-amino-4-deoxy-L-arabinose transferase-like glycosyltransferase